MGASLSAGRRLGPYEVLELLGAGGMGEVYRARDTRLDRDVALKVLRPGGEGADEERARRLEREARTVARLDHPNLLVLFDVGRLEGALFLVTELLRGESLRERLERAGPLDATEAARVGAEIARGLAAAHAHGFVHRDLKPENVFLTADGRVKILDFGLAAPSTGSTATPPGEQTTVDRTSAGAVIGTPSYLAPEQARGDRAEPRSDLFALGALLHECLTGRAPFRRPSIAETLGAVLHAPAPSLATVRGAGALAPIVERCLAKRAEERPRSASEVADALERARRGASEGEAVAVGRSVAVLPFADMSAARDQGYFCEGMAEEVLHALARVEGLRVVARTSSFQFRAGDADAREVGTRLGAETLLEGSVRRAGDRLRVTVQLIDVASGYHLWSERYDRGVEDVFAIQDEVAASVAAALSGVLSEGTRRELRRRGTQDLVAYEHFLRGRQLASQYRAPSWQQAVRELEQAIARDPEFVAAHAALAEVYCHLYLWLGHDPAHLDAARRASDRALELEAECADVLIVRGYVLLLDGRFAESESAFSQALELAGESPTALFLFARLRFGQGRMREASELFERAAAADPDDYQALSLCVMTYESLGERERQIDCARRAVARAERRLEIAPADVRALYLGGIDRIHLGERERALEWLRRARALDPDEAATLYNVACGFARLGQSEEALAGLERMVERGFAYRAWLEHDTDLDSLRAHPRFRALLAKMR